DVGGPGSAVLHASGVGSPSIAGSSSSPTTRDTGKADGAGVTAAAADVAATEAGVGPGGRAASRYTGSGSAGPGRTGDSAVPRVTSAAAQIARVWSRIEPATWACGRACEGREAS